MPHSLIMSFHLDRYHKFYPNGKDVTKLCAIIAQCCNGLTGSNDNTTHSAVAVMHPVALWFWLQSLSSLIYAPNVSHTSTLRSDCQGLTLSPLLTPTVNTMYCDVVLIACLKIRQSNTGSSAVQMSSIWGLGIIGNVDEVEICTLSNTQWPAHSDIHIAPLVSSERPTQERLWAEGGPEEVKLNLWS